MTSADKRRKIKAQLQALKQFENTSLVRALRRELKQKLKGIEQNLVANERQAKRVEQKRKRERPSLKVENASKSRTDEANLKRSRFMKNRHRFIRLVHSRVRGTEYDASYGEISHWISVRKRGKKIPIPDVILYNLSG